MLETIEWSGMEKLLTWMLIIHRIDDDLSTFFESSVWADDSYRSSLYINVAAC